MSGGIRKSNWTSVRWLISVHSSSNMVPVSMKSLALSKAKEEVETENLRLCTIKTVPVFEDGDPLWSTHACLEIEIKGKGKEEKEALLQHLLR